MLRVLVVVFAFATIVVSLPVQSQISGVPRVTGRDALKIGADRVRLHGIDASEFKQTCRAGGREWSVTRIYHVPGGRRAPRRASTRRRASGGSAPSRRHGRRGGVGQSGELFQVDFHLLSRRGG